MLVTTGSPLRGTSMAKPLYESLTADELSAIDRIAVDFEDKLAGGQPVSIESCVADVDESLRSSLLVELLAAEVLNRRDRGESPEPGEYLARFPAMQSAVENAFEEGVIAGDGDTHREPDSDTLPKPPTPPEKWNLPEQFGRYRIVRLLGKG